MTVMGFLFSLMTVETETGFGLCLYGRAPPLDRTHLYTTTFDIRGDPKHCVKGAHCSAVSLPLWVYRHATAWNPTFTAS